ncbi:glucosamine-6-phosphate deaminase [Granulosicoccus sp. 3-233]|uniref:glucosamine-6-phosphate deaminase n=1 Tax=Granulosicoccus sp. 3-233 TaxID=3417969 RepID=UPI003D34F497
MSVRTFPTREAMGEAAAEDVAKTIHQIMERKETVRMIFASAPSQLEMLTSLSTLDIPWSRVEAFHMDEYIGLPVEAPQGFGNWLQNHFFNVVEVGKTHLLDMNGSTDQTQYYARELESAPIDIVCLGIGVNGHIAFNDPPVADFNDPLDIKTVELEPACRQQQVDEGCFATLAEVPTHAVTLTIPRLLRAEHLFCIVPGAHKRTAVTATLHGPVSPDCPASILNTHANCTLYLDAESAPA